MKSYLGCSGWYYEDWIKRFYPEDIKRSEWLSYYSKHFNTVEINSSFYRFPREKTLENWYQRTPEDFKFTLKVNQSITHRKKFKNIGELLNNFYKLSDLLGDKLCCLLFQLPPNLKKNMELLNNAAEQFNDSKTNVMEFRHPSWYDEEVYDFLDDHDIIFCTVSVSDLPPDIVVINSQAYIRFHGTGEDERYQHLYSQQELREWVDRIKKEDIHELYSYFNNDYHANAVLNCQQFKEILKDK
jgi:uncharacterized protein YecE (DUF72 family)